MGRPEGMEDCGLLSWYPRQSGRAEVSRGQGIRLVGESKPITAMRLENREAVGPGHG